MSLLDISNEDRFVRDFNRCAARYRAQSREVRQYASAIFIPFEAGLRGAEPLVDRLMSWMSAEQWHALERMGAEIFVARDARRMGTEVTVLVRHVDAQEVFANNSYVVGRVLGATSRLNTLLELATAIEGPRLSDLRFGEERPLRFLGTEASLTVVAPSVHVQEPAIPASSERRLALNHKLRGKKDVTHSEHQGSKDSVDQCIARRRPRAKRTPRH